MQVECDFLLVEVPIPVRGGTTTVGMMVVQLETDTGIRGTGIAKEDASQAAAFRHLVSDYLGPFVTGRDPTVPERVWHDAAAGLSQSALSSDITARAASAIDQAMWDIAGKVAGEPVYRLLGGAQDEIDIYVTFGLNIYTPEEEAEAAARVQAQGFTAFKLQGAGPELGRDIAHDADRVGRLRETVGDGARIILDGHNAFDVPHAIELAKRIEPFGVAFLDEPMPGRDAVALLQLHRARPELTLAGRSRGGSLWDNRDLIVSGALGVLGTNVRDQGGFSASIKVAHLAEAWHLPLVTGGAWHLQNAHLIAAVPNGWMTEYHLLVAAACETIFIDPIIPVNGRLRLGDRPGLGLELDLAAVAEATERGRVATRG